MIHPWEADKRRLLAARHLEIRAIELEGWARWELRYASTMALDMRDSYLAALRDQRSRLRQELAPYPPLARDVMRGIVDCELSQEAIRRGLYWAQLAANHAPKGSYLRERWLDLVEHMETASTLIDLAAYAGFLREE